MKIIAKTVEKLVEICEPKNLTKLLQRYNVEEEKHTHVTIRVGTS